MTKSSDLLQGTLDLLILKVLCLEPMHGWAIAQRIRQLSSDVLRVNQGALYPALHRLEHQAWIEPSWENRRITGARSTTPSPRPGGSGSRPKSVIGPAVYGRPGRIEGGLRGVPCACSTVRCVV